MTRSSRSSRRHVSADASAMSASCAAPGSAFTAQSAKISARPPVTMTKKLDGVSEDEKKHAEKDIQKQHDDYIAKIEALLKAKEAEILEV